MTFVPAVIMVEGAVMPIEFQFIPETLTVKRSNKWTRQPAKHSKLTNTQTGMATITKKVNI